MTDSLCECSCPDVAPLFSVTDFDTSSSKYDIRTCRRCDLAWTSPIPTDEALSQVYGNDYYTSSTAKFNAPIEAWTRYSGTRRAIDLLEQHGTESERLKVLDVGCGRGVLLQGFLDQGHEVLGIEREGSGFDSLPHVESLSLDDLISAERRFDLVVVWHVLEHLGDPQKTLAKLSQLLNDEGSLFIEVPNFGSFQSKLFKSNWFHLDVPRHLYHFTAKCLDLMTTSTGFEVISSKSFSLDQNLYGFLQSSFNTLPFLPNNHLYGVLKSGFSLKSMWVLMLYATFVGGGLILAVFELIIAQVYNRGAVLSLHLKQSKKR